MRVCRKLSRPQPPEDPLYIYTYIYWGLPAVGAATEHGSSLLDKRKVNTINNTITISMNATYNSLRYL